MQGFEDGEALEQSIHSEDFEPFAEEADEGSGEPTEGGDATGGKGVAAGSKEESAGSPPSEGIPSGDVEIDVPGVGKLKASDIRALHSQAAYYHNLQEKERDMDSERQRLEALEGDLGEALELQKLLDYGDVRQRIQKTIGELFADGNISPISDGRSKEFLDELRGRRSEDSQAPVDPQTQAKIQELENYVAQIRMRENDNAMNQMFDAYAKDYPEIVTDDFRNKVMDDALRVYADDPDALGVRELEALAGKEILSQMRAVGEQSGAIKDALKDLPPGARVVKGGNRHTATPPLKDPRNMEWSEIEEEGSGSFFEEATG